ncbi:hypothetical protein MKW98_011869 [Papaver atlanticum]|uniref:Uncharacterized protein n=1 Tax=Papaver atlanticum TaxID=357466 RepID=A0AAD4TCA2_9MAGN|nr:hypothetical protein MKW98_021212 [Papaver atlanticum]KAI3947579.1 hypothetical protein MKW98_025976 [Papaver atlanticum]KAI3948283.1 hypothetical protein MKW98_011869 [Papaver atlanticum]
MAAAKTSLVLFLFALIAISANLQMVSAVGVDCSIGLALKLDLLNGVCPSDAYCAGYCNAKCQEQFHVDALVSACVYPVLGALVKVCSCCCPKVL